MTDNWTKFKISEFIDINPKIPLKRGEEYSFVEMKDLDPSNKYVLPSVKKELKGGARFQNGDTLFARITPCLENGKICQVKGLEMNLGFGSTEFLIFRGKKHISDSDFIFYLSRTPFFRKFSEAKMIGTSGRQRVAKDAFGNLELSLPPLKKQKAIASILSAIDNKIELNLQINKTLEEMAMALYKHWFVDFGPFQDGEFVDSELGKIPKGWNTKNLNDLGNIFYGKMPKKKLKQEDGFPIFSGYRNVGYYPLSNCEKGKVIIVARGVGGAGDVKMTTERCFLTNLSIYLENNLELIDDSILFFSLKRRGLDYLRTGSAQPQITIRDLNTVILQIPPQEIQVQFLKLFKSLLLKQDSNCKENQKLSRLRDTLLPKLISGEVRVKDEEKTLTEVL